MSPTAHRNRPGLDPMGSASRQWRQESLCLGNRKTRCSPPYIARHPLRKWDTTRPMCAGRGVLVPRLGQLCFRKSRREPHERRPQPSMDIRHLAADQLAYEDVGMRRHSLRHAEDLMTLGVTPPAPLNGATRNRLGKTRHWPARGLKHDPVAFDEGQSLLRGHVSVSSDTCLGGACSGINKRVRRPG